MTEFADLVYLFNVYNLIGNPLGTLTVPNLNIEQNTDDDYAISYSFLKTDWGHNSYCVPGRYVPGRYPRTLLRKSVDE